MIYLDAAYLVKCYVLEPGSAAVRSLASNAGRVGCCAYGRAEVAAAVHRKVREGQLAAADRGIVLEQMRLDDRNQVICWFPVTTGLLDAVARAFETLPAGVLLRAGDALHLACAREQGFAEVYSSDRHLLTAAPAFGLVGCNALA
jgi:predicted nucleic acid-binding protein